MIDTFMAWAQAFMLQVALTARSGPSGVMSALSLGIFLYVMFRGVLRLTTTRLNKILLALPVFVGSFSILLYISLARVEFQPAEIHGFLLAMSYISGAVLCWCFFLLLRDICLVFLRIYRRFGGEKLNPALKKTAEVVSTGGRLLTNRGPVPENEPVREEKAEVDMARRKFLCNGGLFAVSSALGAVNVSNALDLPYLVQKDMSFGTLPAQLDGLRIVQLSDLHIGALQTPEWLAGVVGRTNSLNPDIIFITGDLVDGSPAELLPMVQMLSQLKAKYGVYSCAGNHEFYSGIERWLPHFRQNKLNMLRNEHREVEINGVSLSVIGLNDKNESVKGMGPDLDAALSGAPEGLFRILLEHHPEFAPQRAGRVDLMLSGHTHGGQMILLRPLVRRANGGFVAGEYDVDGLKLYVNSGTGVWGGLPMRFEVPAEITLITLHSLKKPA